MSDDDPWNESVGDAELEAQLCRLPLRRPPDVLDARIQDVCRRRKRTSLRIPGMVAGLAALAAAVTVALGLAPHLINDVVKPGTTLPQAPTSSVVPPVAVATPTVRPPAPAPPAAPLRIEQTVARVSADGVVGVSRGAPVQRYRRQTVRQVWIVDPRTRERVLVTVPREEVVLRRVEPL